MQKILKHLVAFDVASPTTPYEFIPDFYETLAPFLWALLVIIIVLIIVFIVYNKKK